MSIISELKLEENIPVVMADQSGCIIWVNSKFEETFKWSSSEILGKPLTIIIPAKLHDAHNLGFSRFLTTEKSAILDKPLNLEAVDKNGIIFSAEHLIQSEKENGSWIFAARIRPLEDMEKINKKVIAAVEEITDAK